MTTGEPDRGYLPEGARRALAHLPLPAMPGVAAGSAPLAERMTYHAVPGVAIAVLRDDRIAWTAGFGGRATGQPEPVTERTLFQAASISKPITALAVLRMVQDGHLDLDADVNGYLASWQVPSNGDWQPRVTLRQLLSHTAGTTVHGFVGYRSDQPQPTLRQILDGAPPANSLPVRVAALPGTRLRYSGGGTCIVQQVLEDVRGQPFASLMHDLVLDPLEMADSTFAQPLPAELHNQAATGHRSDGEPVAGGWHVYPEQAPAGLWSTPTDLLRAAMEVLRARVGQGTILSAASAEAMLTHGPVGDIGIGFFSGGEGSMHRFGHGGDNDGFKALLDVYIETGLGIAVMANGDLGGALISEIIGAVAREDGWPMVPGESVGTYRVPRPAADLDAVTQAAVPGTYELRPDFLLTLRHEHGRLMLTVPGQPAIPLRSVAADRLEAAALELELTLERDGDRVVGIVVHQGDDEQHAHRH